jgi:hypothetical protein
MKIGPDAISTAEIEFGRTKHENGTRRHQYRRKESGLAKLENETRRPQYSLKRVRAQNMKTGHNALGTPENKSGNAKRENGTRRPRYRRKRVSARKT